MKRRAAGTLVFCCLLAVTGVVHVAFTEHSEDDPYWGLRWTGDHTNELQTLHDDGKLTWDTGTLSGFVDLLYDSGTSYVRFIPYRGTMLRVR